MTNFLRTTELEKIYNDIEKYFNKPMDNILYPHSFGFRSLEGADDEDITYYLYDLNKKLANDYNAYVDKLKIIVEKLICIEDKKGNCLQIDIYVVAINKFKNLMNEITILINYTANAHLKHSKIN